MDTQKKRKKNEVNTKTQKPKNKDNHSKKKRKKRRNQKLTTDYQEKEKGKEMRNIPRKNAAQIGRGKLLEQSRSNRKSKRRGKDLEQ